MNIRLSDNHGVNPSLGVCFWCGGDTGDILLLGRLPGDEPAPMRAVYSYLPCATCQADWQKGIVLIEAKHAAWDTRPQIQPGVWPTGRWAILTRDAAARFIREPLMTVVQKAGKAFVPPEVFNLIQPPEDAQAC
jgi:hypothetical protein